VVFLLSQKADSSFYYKPVATMSGQNREKIMNCKRALIWKIAARTVTATLCLTILSGCSGGFKLVSFGADSEVSGWHQYDTLRSPLDQVEETVIEVAETRENAKTDESEIIFIFSDLSKAKPVQVVDVVGNTKSKDQFPLRTVTRYRILDGLISAMSEPVYEFYVNADLERAILRAIAVTWSPDRLIIYNDGTRSMSIVSYAVNKCTTDIKIYEAGVVAGKPLAQKRVAFCFAR
jgi:hypothetical protein